jgi:hypothetical protein
VSTWPWYAWLALVVGLIQLVRFWQNRHRFGHNVVYLLLAVVFVLIWADEGPGSFGGALRPTYLFYSVAVIFFGIGYLTCWWLLGRPEKRVTKQNQPPGYRGLSVWMRRRLLPGAPASRRHPAQDPKAVPKRKCR